MDQKRKIIVAVNGASGALYARLLLEELNNFLTCLDEVAVVFSSNATDIWNFEVEIPFKPVFPFKKYGHNDFFAPFASGSAAYDTMIICPCSMGTLGRIANGISDDLITRAADVILKENRRLILVPREAPYNLIHLENMTKIIRAGGVICPASPSFYSKPQTLTDALNTIIYRILNLSGFENRKAVWGAD